MEADDSKFKTLSKIISRSLKQCGKSAYISNLCKSKSNLLDVIWTERMKPRVQVFHGGSSAEGTTTASSDVDRMVVVNGIKVITTGKYDNALKENQFFMKTTESNPGYVRLKAGDTQELDHLDFGDFKAVLDCCEDGLHLSSDKFVNFLYSANSPPGPGASKFYYRHGPCLMVEHENIFGYYRNKPGEHLETDVAFSLVCDKWPEESREWITRTRHHNWPNLATVEKIAKQECHAVAVGDPTSPFRSQEWRVSFLLGERELVWNFNDTQIQTYIILKMLRKKHIEPLAPDQLSSYHLKTVIFWLIEDEGESRWYEENLLECLKDCLEKLSDCIKDGVIEHYFHRKRNLLQHKLTSQTERDKVLKEISAIRENIVTYTLSGGMTITSKVYKLWCAYNNDIDLLIGLCSNDKELTTYYEIVLRVNDALRLHESQFNVYANTCACCDALEKLLQIGTVLKQTTGVEIDGQILNTVLRFLDIITGIAYYRQYALEDSNPIEKNGLLENCRENLVAGSAVDDLSGNLYLATFYFCTNQLLLCQDAVKTALPQSGRFLYTGRCSPNLGIEIDAGKLVLTREVPVTGEDDEVIRAVFDIVFTKADINFVPYAVKFECALIPDYGDRFLVYHPCVYSRVLLYLSLFATGQIKAADETLKDLCVIVSDLGFTPQRFRALNLIGFCYSMKGDFSNAMFCYIASLRDTFNMAAVTNAAAYHIVLLLFGVYCKAEEDIFAELTQKSQGSV